ncbi:MAG: hypothetical protein Q9227_008035 [Pyrenula ochraceoflavens]
MEPHSKDSVPRILSLPTELCDMVTDNLDCSDFDKLRLVNRDFTKLLPIDNRKHDAQSQQLDRFFRRGLSTSFDVAVLVRSNPPSAIFNNQLAVYKALEHVQGTLIPVCLGVVDSFEIPVDGRDDFEGPCLFHTYGGDIPRAYPLYCGYPLGHDRRRGISVPDPGDEAPVTKYLRDCGLESEIHYHDIVYDPSTNQVMVCFDFAPFPRMRKIEGRNMPPLKPTFLETLFD